ncbi:MAG TPA: antibiotic biosynthesis monooxygenase family protein [Nitrososphaeraceae archaeon]|jgi:quinol monooxygenase YgiN|nr:antibiotic biosynthesis monooxygenase family protein [Nitrososphaeraceae archaeon]
MAKLIEMDEKATLKDQMENEAAGPVVLINKFNVDSDEVEQFLEAWKEDATKFKDQSGFISAQLHKGIGKSRVFVNYAVWESLDHFKNAVDNVIGPDFQSQLSKYPKSLVVSPHLFKKVAVQGICLD